MIQAIQLILALSFLVLIHELGHFTFARIFKVRVEKFYMFFNPWRSIFRMKKFEGKWHFKFFAKNKDEEWAKYPETTEWGIGWLPFGGYCAIGGMVDETHKSEDLAPEPQSWEFRSKPAWQRMLIILGGIMVNFVGALIIYWMLLWQYGTDKLPLRNMTDGLYYSQMWLDEGFQQKDKILSVNGIQPRELGDLSKAIILNGKRDIEVQRGDSILYITLSPEFSDNCIRVLRSKDKSPVQLGGWLPCKVDTVIPNMPAALAGMQKGDSIVAVNGEPAACMIQMNQALEGHANDTVEVTYFRGEEQLTSRMVLGDDAKLGIQVRDFVWDHKSYSFFRALPAGVKFGWRTLAEYVEGIGLVFTRSEVAKSVGGFGAIGSMFPSTWSWPAFWYMTAFLSIILAFMNFLPIPALDGGYVLFLLWEMITRRKPSDRFLEIANQIGFWLLMALLILANGNDILRLFS